MKTIGMDSVNEYKDHLLPETLTEHISLKDSVSKTTYYDSVQSTSANDQICCDNEITFSGYNYSKSESLAKKHQYLTAVSASLICTSIGCALTWITPTLPKIIAHEAPLYLDSSQISWLLSMSSLGSLLSPLLTENMTRRFGRKNTLLISGYVLISAYILKMFTFIPVFVYIARYLDGVVVGFVHTVLPIYIGEISSPGIRGSLNVISVCMMKGGILLTLSLGPYVSYHTLLTILLLIPLTFVVTFSFMPESPYHSLEIGSREKAINDLFWLQGRPKEPQLQSELNHIEKYLRGQTHSQPSLKDIFSSRAARKAMMISIILDVGMRLSGFSIFIVFGTLIIPQHTLGVLNPSNCMILLGFASFLSTLIGIYIADMFGRKPLFIFSYIGCSISMLSLSIWYYLDLKTEIDISSTNFVPFIGLLVLFISYEIGCSSAVFVVRSEFYPSTVKTKLSAICSMCDGITVFFTIQLYIIITNWEGVYLNCLTYAMSSFLITLYIAVYIPETRGKSLQEIQILLSQDTHQNPLERDTQECLRT